MDLNIAGSYVVVVGGATGIGRAIAQAFAAEGAHVAVVDINPLVAEVAVALTQQWDVQACHYVADVTDLAALQEVAQNITAELGPVDHLIYTAGIGSGKVGMPFWNIEPSDWQKVLDTCLVGAVNTLHALTPSIRDQRSGTVCLIASVAGQFGSQTDPPYSAAKAGLLNFMQVAAKDLAPYNIRVNAINPGLIDTPLQRRIHAGVNESQSDDQQVSFEQWFTEKVQRVIPLQRPQTAEDVAKMVLWLASDACMNVTGQSINVDGGFVMN